MRSMETTILTPHSAGDHGRQGLPPRQERHGDHEHPGDQERLGLLGDPGPHEDPGDQGAPGDHGGLSRASATAQETAENLNSPAAAPPGAYGDHEGQSLHEPPGDHGRQELSIPEAALAVGLSISTIRRLIQNGRLPARYERGDKGQNRYFIALADLAPLAALGTNSALAAMGSHGDRLSTHDLQAPGPDP